MVKLMGKSLRTLVAAGLLGLSQLLYSQEPADTITRRDMKRAYIHYANTWERIDTLGHVKLIDTDHWFVFRNRDLRNSDADTLALTIDFRDSLGNKSYLFGTSDKDFKIKINEGISTSMLNAKDIEYRIDALREVDYSKDLRGAISVNGKYYVPIKSVTGNIAEIIGENIEFVSNFSWVSENLLDNMADLENTGVEDDRKQYILARLGVTPQKIKELEDRGLIPMDTHYGGYTNNTLMHEVIALGTLSAWNADSARDAAFHSIFTFTVDKYFKTPEDLKDKKELKILYFAGPVGGGSRVEIAGSENPVVGTRMLLYADRGYLEYYLKNVKQKFHGYGPEYLLPAHDSPIWDGNNGLMVSELETGIRIDGDPSLNKKMPLDEFLKKFVTPVIEVVDR
jgi:hypothetical protein